MGKMRIAHVLVGKSERNKRLRSKRGWEDNIKVYFKETRWEGANWIHGSRMG
jgi:hypothetical protein